LHKPETNKKLFFLESPDSREYAEVEYFVKKGMVNMEDVCLVAISKSGSTAETLEAFHKIFEILSEKFGKPVTERVLVISSTNSPIWKMAEEKKIERLEWEGDVGGRWSAFTIAHTTVLSIAGLDTESFVEGGKESGFNEKAEKLASGIFENYENGFNILDFFFFNSELEDLGKWCRQLLAESLGKKNNEGEEVGLTPTVSIGPTDLHSMLQLNLGGPKNKFTLFIRSLKEIDGGVNEKAYEDVIGAYKEALLPFEKYEMPKINEYEMGKFMAFLMTVTLKLAEKLLVDPYGQPEVEEYKKHLNKN
jgi:glucose-6-phosphate isomerase